MLDGKLIDLCNVTCVDEEAGCIEQYAVRDGKYVIDQSGEWPETEKVYGVVKIIEKAE